jgi:predicted  nucleic acid-binding Zn-ribbon protein
VLQQYEAEEALSGERPTIEKSLQAAEAELAARRADIDREEAVERERLAGIDAERATEMSGLPAATRSRYERIHAQREGRAVVAILKSACGGCFRQQPPQTLQEARRRERVMICDGCGRMLVWPPDAA